MKHTFKFLGLGAGIAVFSFFSACSSGTGTPAGKSDAGDETGGAGGATAGGASNAGGKANAGGNSNAGTGTGGGTSTACKATTLYNFSSDLQNFKFSNVVGTAPYVNLAAPGDAGVSSTPPTLAWASKDYDGAATAPNAGSMMITATYTNWNQQVAVEVNGPSDALNNPINLKSSTLHVKVMLVKGLSPSTSAPGGIVFYIKSGTDYAWGQATWTNLDSLNTWIDIKFDTDAPDSGSAATWDSTKPVQLGFQIGSGGGGTVGAFGSTALDTIVYIDNVTVQPNGC